MLIKLFWQRKKYMATQWRVGGGGGDANCHCPQSRHHLSSQLQPVSACAVQTHLLQQARELSKARAPSVFQNNEKSLWVRALEAWVPTRYVVCLRGRQCHVKTTATASKAEVMMQQKAEEDHCHSDWKREHDWETPGHTPCCWRPPQNAETQAFNSPNSHASGNSLQQQVMMRKKAKSDMQNTNDTSGVFASHLSLSLCRPSSRSLFLTLSGSFSLSPRPPPPPLLIFYYYFWVAFWMYFNRNARAVKLHGVAYEWGILWVWGYFTAFHGPAPSVLWDPDQQRLRVPGLFVVLPHLHEQTAFC